jgi:DNA invertase Pin-like site-specific DNA recombinase
VNNPDPSPQATQPTPGPAAPAAAPSPLRLAKIRDGHRDRLAVVYIRQSTPQQVFENRESRERQYALAGYAVTLGWPRARVVVMDEDQGHSGTSAADRAGFHRLLAEVTMGHVGLVLGLEMSRLARSNKDWHQLLEVCALCGTLLADQDGVYDPRDCNDRLLLGLKGTMSEFELVTMRNRLERGKLNKAERGALFLSVPAGYLKLPTGEVVQDPDEQVRAAVALVFDKFDELGSCRAVFDYLIRHHVRLGGRARCGPQRGQLEWRRPTLRTLALMLHHPIYAGAYAYGRRARDPRRCRPGSRAAPRWLPMDQWKVLRRDALPAYISWDRYLGNLRRLEANRQAPDARGTARRGTALLAGLVVCGTCGLRLRPRYRRADQGYYSCPRHQERGTPQVCYGVTAAVVDAVVAAQVLRALEPAALELSLQAAQDIQTERERLDRHWQQQLERARYEAERARRQYDAAEPENRLVARTLEQRWEEALRRQRQLQEEYDRFRGTQPPGLTETERTRVRALAADLPGLWHAAGTTPADRKEIVRCLVDRVVVQVRQHSEQVGVTIHWKGGFTSDHQAVRPVKRYAQLEGYEQLRELIVRLRREGHSAAGIAERLNAAGYRTPKKRRAFSPELVRTLLSRRGLAAGETYGGQLGPSEWRLRDLAAELRMPADKLRDWAARGWLHCRRTPAQDLCIAWADREELQRLRKLRKHSRRGARGYPAELTTPKPRKTNGAGRA